MHLHRMNRTTPVPHWLNACLTGPVQAPADESAATWLDRWASLCAQGGSPFELAVRGGLQADRLAWAFASGHQAAIRALLPAVAPHEVVAFCLTEPSGNRPRDLQSTATATADGHWLLTGEKRWATLGPVATHLLVVCRQADATGTAPALRVARIASPAKGLQIEPMPATKFVPELPHAAVHLDGLRVHEGDWLPGDGWDVYGKPFRTLEDLFIAAAILALLLRESRAHAWPGDFAQRAVATLLACQGLANQSADAPATHVALAGVLAQARALYADAATLWSAGPVTPAGERWLRDAKLLGLSAGTQAQRTARAWQRLAAPA